MKKIVSLLVVCALLISMCFSAFATNLDVTNNDVKMKILTDEQYITRLSEVKHISKNEAAKIVNSHKTITLDGGSQYKAEFYYTENVGPGWNVEVGALCTVASGSGHSNFVKVQSDAVWSNAVGSGAHTWESFYKDATITNPSTLKLMTRGNLTITIGTQMSASLKAAFVDAGFSVSGTQYFRKTVSISGYKYLG